MSDKEVTSRCRKHQDQHTDKTPTRLCEDCWRQYIKAQDYHQSVADYNNMDSDSRNGR